MHYTCVLHRGKHQDFFSLQIFVCAQPPRSSRMNQKLWMKYTHHHSNSATAGLFVLIALRHSRVPANTVNAQLGLIVITRGAPQVAAALLSKVPVSLGFITFSVYHFSQLIMVINQAAGFLVCSSNYILTSKFYIFQIPQRCKYAKKNKKKKIHKIRLRTVT